MLVAGINCGVLLIRNTKWARQFFADVGQYAYMPEAELVSTMRPVRTTKPSLCPRKPPTLSFCTCVELLQCLVHILLQCISYGACICCASPAAVISAMQLGRLPPRNHEQYLAARRSWRSRSFRCRRSYLTRRSSSGY